MIRLALPIFHKRISPVLDSCERLLIIDIEKKNEINRKEIFINKLALSERIKLLRQLEVSTVICWKVVISTRSPALPGKSRMSSAPSAPNSSTIPNTTCQAISVRNRQVRQQCFIALERYGQNSHRASAKAAARFFMRRARVLSNLFPPNDVIAA
jgi:hypothetical protein